MLCLAREVQAITGGGYYDAAHTALLELVPDAGSGGDLAGKHWLFRPLSVQGS
jgi:hypothetical protein